MASLFYAFAVQLVDRTDAGRCAHLSKVQHVREFYRCLLVAFVCAGTPTQSSGQPHNFVGPTTHNSREPLSRSSTECKSVAVSNYQSSGSIRDKDDVVSAGGKLHGNASYKSNVIDVGWTNGVYTNMQALLGQSAPTQLLSPAELEKIIPATVFFKGQTSTVQLRNAGGARFPEGILFIVKVDVGGYATSVQERYQDYLVTEVPLHFGSQTLPPGAYGCGFTADGFLVMDLGGNSLFTAPTSTNSKLRRPTPLQLTTTPTGLRLFSGRSYVGFNR